MPKYLFLGLALTGLVACGDPLAGIDRLSDVDVAENDPAASALPTETEVARDGFFGADPATADNAILTTPVDDGDVVVTTQDAAVEEKAPRGGIVGLFRRVGGIGSSEPAAFGAAEQPAIDAAAIDVAIAQAQDVPTAPDSVIKEIENVEDAAPVQLASLEPKSSPRGPRRRGIGLFGRAGSGAPVSTKSDDVTDVAYGTQLPFGVIARECEARGKSLGRKIESASARGYKLYDSDPGSLAQRTYYITGFADNCPRQLTAANVIFGAPSRYEELHYGPTGRDLSYGATDKAYDVVKRQVCGARKGKPCGGKIQQMDKTTFFVTSYARFDTSSEWSEVLIHDGRVMATAVKSVQ